MANIVRRALNALGLSEGPDVNPSNSLAEVIRANPWGWSLLTPAGANYSAETPEVRQRYREMLREPTVKAAVLSKIWDVAALDLSVTPDDPENQRDKDIADFNRDNLVNSKGGIRAITESIALGALMDGYSLCHKRTKIAERGRWKGRMVLDALRPKDSDYYYLQFDQFLNPQWVVDRYAEDKEKQYLDPGLFVIVRHLQVFDAPYGMSDFRAADRAYCSLWMIQQVRLAWIDKWKGPFLHGKSNDETIRNQLGNELALARANGWVVTDRNTDIEILNLATGSEDAFQSACRDFREEIATGITGAFLQMMGGQSGVQRGSSSEHSNTAKLFRWYLAQLVCDAINDQIIPEFTDANFAGSPAYPKATLSGVDAKDILADLEIAAAKLDLGGEISKKELDRRSAWGPAQDDNDRLVRQADPFNLDKLMNPLAEPPANPKTPPNGIVPAKSKPQPVGVVK